MIGKILSRLGAAMLLAAAPAQAVSLLVYYDGTASGNTLTDMSGNGRHALFDANGSGTTPTFLTTTPAYTGSGAYVSLPSDGTTGTSAKSGRYNVTHSTGLSYDFNNQSWSMAMFYNRQSSATVDTLFHLGLGDGYGGENELYAWGTNGGTQLQLHHYPGPDVNLSVNNTVNLNAWHHLSLTFTASGLSDGKGVLNLYVDGALAGTDNDFFLDTNNTFFFGGQGSSLAERNFVGFMDDMALFDGVLTASEVASLANGSLNPISVVPEPSRALLLLTALSVALFARRRPAVA